MTTTNWPVIIEWPDRLPFEVVTPAGCKCITNLATGRRQVTYKTAGQLRVAIERIRTTGIPDDRPALSRKD